MWKFSSKRIVRIHYARALYMLYAPILGADTPYVPECGVFSVYSCLGLSTTFITINERGSTLLFFLQTAQQESKASTCTIMFLIYLLISGLGSFIFYFIAEALIESILGTNKISFYLSCVISLIIIFWCTSGEYVFFSIIGAICGLALCYSIKIKKIDVCPECGAWNAYKLVDKRNIKQEKGFKLFHNKKKIYDGTGRDIIATIDEGHEQRECLITYYDAVYKCQKCGAEKIIKEKK